ncbi:hypothetical protein GCM10012287_28540 [Streptomyces daqingensis]|uniref:Secreted protein n=1 Tax=Streptomyces daqingensis TaxID=1472640 RepID=A0ABQ2MDT3_9ACTN|nr:hypothetical protein GCM10012287_28540 [Streptomyces daqingensis]
MAALSWLLIPILAAVAAGVWSSWASRRRTGIPDSAGVAGYERFRAAMERSRSEETDHPAVSDPATETFGQAPRPTPDRPARTAE